VNSSKLTSLAALALVFLAPVHLWAESAAPAPLVVEDLQCRGNRTTSCGFILTYLYLDRGNVLNEDEVRNAQLRLSTLHMFESVNIFLERGSERGKTVVVVDVTETNPLSTEWLVGTSYHLGRWRSVTAGRLTDSNLFGNGKFADLTASTVQAVNGTADYGNAAALRYVDPHLFESRRYFAVAAANYSEGYFKDRYGNFDDVDLLTLTAALGRRLWDFSYLTVGYSYRLRLDEHGGFWQEDGTFDLHESRNRQLVNVSYGWNSEDDFYFPTSGSSFRTGFGWAFGSSDPNNAFYFSFRKTWPVGEGFFSFKLGDNPSSDYRQNLAENQLVTATLGAALPPGNFVRRGRWYMEAGFSPLGYKEAGRGLNEFGLKLGVRLETSSLGLVDLYVLGAEDLDR